MPRPDRSRAALVDAAAVLFRRQGYAATGLNQILDSADVRAGSLYHHFPKGKQELAAAVVDTVGARIEQLLRQLLATAPAQDVIAHWIDLLIAGLDADGRDGCPIEPMATESVHASELVRLSSAKVFAGWCAAIAERLESEGLPREAASVAATSVLALIEGALMLSRTAGDPGALHAAQASARSLLSR